MADRLLAVLAKSCIIWPVGQAVKTRPFHGCNMGSIPVRVTKKLLNLRIEELFRVSVRGIEQDGRPQAAKNNPADCFLVRGRWTHGSPKSSALKEAGLFSL